MPSSAFIEYERRRRARAAPTRLSCPAQASAAHGLLRLAIRSGVLHPGAELSEQHLIEALGASRNAVRHALRMLADEGLVVRRPRHGTHVSGGIVEIPLGGLQSVAPTWNDHDARVSHRLLCQRDVPATPVLCERLDIQAADVSMVEHLLLLDDEPICLRVGYLPVDAAATRARTVAGELDELNPPRFDHLVGFSRGHSETTIEAVACPPRSSHLLGVAEGSPILQREMLTYDRDGMPLELSFSSYPGGKASFFSRAALPGVVVPGPRSV